MALYKGVFWITKERDERYLFRIPCDTQGNIVGSSDYPLCSKDGTNYNHKLLWEMLPKSLTANKPFDYYPRGRVEIRNEKAIVYLNPDINTAATQQFIVSQFGLVESNGITSVRFVSDGSRHYFYKNI